MDWLAVLVLITALPALAAGLLIGRLGVRRSARIQNLFCSLVAALCWFVTVYLIGVDPARWFELNMGDGWANFMELLTLLLPLGFAPEIAAKLSRERA